MRLHKDFNPYGYFHIKLDLKVNHEAVFGDKVFLGLNLKVYTDGFEELVDNTKDEVVDRVEDHGIQVGKVEEE